MHPIRDPGSDVMIDTTLSFFILMMWKLKVYSTRMYIQAVSQQLAKYSKYHEHFKLLTKGN